MIKINYQKIQNSIHIQKYVNNISKESIKCFNTN